ncbi:unnamed protein product (mitochondrion) [Plasmodiophora brassicae]|uniref:MORN repeat-containing protein n=1 Tax=Plasmodiophora brassicae TaxID=37360 RepID=A0A0G4IXQ3_PLABS|nr:hypothetical protein PBRA_007771 [Plasmodiophora brassicae]SPQ99075.1 unnamed protein product [Plasmodiophora brassicae]
MLAGLAVAIVGAAGQPPGASRESSSPDEAAPPERGLPAVVIDKQQWHRAKANHWVHKTDGSTYTGDAIQNPNGDGVVPHGHGRHVVADEAAYTGQWYQGLPHGEGHASSVDGLMSYQGTFKHGQWAGFGVAIETADGGRRYEGHRVSGARHGHGTWTDTDGQVLEGQWRQGFFEGRGRVVLADGRTLDGQFRQWDPVSNSVCGFFRGQIVDAMGQDIARLKRWVSKRDVLGALPVLVKRERTADDGGGGQSEGDQQPKLVKTEPRL